MAPQSINDRLERLYRIELAQHLGPAPKTGTSPALHLRNAAGLTVEQVGQACGASGAEVTAWEHGRIRPPVDQGLRWLDFLHEESLRATDFERIFSNGDGS